MDLNVTDASGRCAAPPKRAVSIEPEGVMCAAEETRNARETRATGKTERRREDEKD